MRTLLIVMTLAGTLLLSGCQQGGPTTSSTPPQEIPPVSAWNTINVPEVGISFPFWRNVYVGGSVNDGSYDPATRGEYSFLMSSSQEVIEGGGEIDGIHYDIPSGGFLDWSIPRIAREMVRQSAAAGQECPELPEGFYLPVNVHRPKACSVFLRDDGVAVLAAVGTGYPHESLEFPTDMVVLFADNQAIVFSDMLDFPQLDATLKEIADAYAEEHPRMEYPDARFDQLSERISVVLDAQFGSPTPEIRNALQALVTIGKETQLR